MRRLWRGCAGVLACLADAAGGVAVLIGEWIDGASPDEIERRGG